MKKRTIIALIVAVALIIVGGMLLTLGLSYATDSTPESTLSQLEVLIQEPFESIQIDTDDCDVTFVPYEGTANACVVILEQEEVGHRVQVEDGTLKIEMIDHRDWTDHISIFGVFDRVESMEMTVYLPETEYASVQTTTTTGDIQIPETLSGGQILLRSNTGDIRCAGTVSDLLSVITNTGEIWIQGCTPEVLELESDTGDMALEAIPWGGEFHIKSDTGDVEMCDVSCRILTAETTTGDQALERVVAEEYLQTFSDTGDISLEYCDSAQVNIETNTGDVSGHFMSDKSFDAHSNTGNVRVAHTQGADPCRVQSDNGDIYFY